MFYKIVVNNFFLGKGSKYSIMILFACTSFFYSKAQYKIVKLESDNMYIRYYYKTDSSDAFKNDSTYFLCLRNKKDTVRIEKFVNSIQAWTHLYTIERAKKNLRIRQKNGRKIKVVYEPFYIAKLVE
jgi:hypothetical protein